jgi:hypothetical protein
LHGRLRTLSFGEKLRSRIYQILPVHRDKRLARRIPATEYNEFMDRQGNVCGCYVVNMSRDGICISTGVSLRAGQTITFLKPSCRAKVIWIRDGQAGLKFL